MRAALVARARRYASVVLRGSARSRSQVLVARASAVLVVLLGLAAIGLLVGGSPLGALAALELAALALLAGILVLPPAAKGRKRRGGTEERVDPPDAIERVESVSATLASFRELAAAQPLGPTALPPVLAPLPAEPLVTIVIPALNEQTHIAGAIRSALAQTWARTEVVVVDDGSYDGTPAIIARLQSANPRLRAVRHATPQGLSAARNAGVARASGDLLVFLDGDDALHPGAIERRVAALLASDLRITVGAAGGIALVAADWTLPKKAKLKPRVVGAPVSIFTVGIRSPFAAHAVLLRRDALDDVGAFDEALRHGGEDLDLWLRLLHRGYSFALAPFMDGYYRQRPGSMIADGRTRHLDTSLGLLRDSDTTDERVGPFDAGQSATDFVVAERVYRWAVSMLLAGAPAAALDTLRLLTPTERLALRSAIDLDQVALTAVQRDELRHANTFVRSSPRWLGAAAQIERAIVDVTVEDVQELREAPAAVTPGAAR